MCDVVGVHTISAKSVHGALSDLVLGQFGDEVGLMAIVSGTHGHVSLAASIDDVEKITLDESLLTWR
jgi:hypothetical protein